jgi:DNA-binding HxlR family transcriptional regulator
MHNRLKDLVELGALDRRRTGSFPREGVYELTGDGERMLDLERTVVRWLADAPEGELRLGTPAAKRVIDTLVAGWNTSIVTSLAGHPNSLTELDRLVESVPYPSLERRVIALREAGLISVAEGVGPGTPYEATTWLRQAAAPLLAAAVAEHRSSTLSSLQAPEMRAVLLLAAPLVRLPSRSRGKLAVVVYPESTTEGEPESSAPIGANLSIRKGRVVDFTMGIDEAAPNWALGTPSYWSDAALDGIVDRLRVGGVKPRLGLDLATGVHRNLSELSAAAEADYS